MQGCCTSLHTLKYSTAYCIGHASAGRLLGTSCVRKATETMRLGMQARREASAAEHDKEVAKKASRSERRESSHSKRSRSPVKDRKSRSVS